MTLQPRQFVILIIVASGLLDTHIASACSPAPTCWIGESTAYLKDMCRQAAKNPDSLRYVDEPEHIGRFITACAKLRIMVKRPRG